MAEGKHSNTAGVRKYFFFIKENVSSDWKDLAFHLDFRRSDIDNISGRNLDDKYRCMDLLEEWLKCNGERATVEVLMEALSQSNLQSTVDGLKNKYPELKTPQASSSQQEMKELFQKSVQKYYELKLTYFKPLIWNDNFTVTLSDIFTQLELIPIQEKQLKMPDGHQVWRGQGTKLNSLDDLFKPDDGTGQAKAPRCILIEGEAGGGKTTFLSKAALDAVSQKTELGMRHDIVLLIRLREVREGETIDEMVWDQCVPETTEGVDVESIRAILQRDESRVLFLLDGYDELRPEARADRQAIPKLLTGKLYPTAQSWSPPDPRQECSSTLGQTAMYTSWEDQGVVSTGTMTGLYDNLLTCLVRKYCKREGVHMPTDGLPAETMQEFLAGRYVSHALMMNQDVGELLDLSSVRKAFQLKNLLRFTCGFNSQVAQAIFTELSNLRSKVFPHVHVVLKNVPGLMALNLTFANLTPSSLQQVVQEFSHMSQLEELDLSFNPDLGDAGMDVLKDGLSSIPKLTVLRLGGYFGDGMTALGMASMTPYMRHLAGLRELDITDNKIGDTGLESLTDVLHVFTALQVLGLRRTRISSAGMRTLVPALCKLTRMMELDISNNIEIGDPGLECLVDILPYLTGMKVLKIWDIGVTDRGIFALVEALPHLPELQVLDVRYNNIEESGIVSLVQTLCQPVDVAQNTAPHCNSTVQELHIGTNKGVTGATLETITQLISALPSLTELDLSGHYDEPAHLSDTAASTLAEALPRLPALEKLSLSNISVGPEGFKVVMQAAEEHPKLDELS
ncbi:hypothetical protein Bbelb_074200 [Branchiostoma belcheri]|nr:hypothetical protein Bbelb_074200 [Branchiostoma belcheri]